MATFCVMLHESDREIQPPPIERGFHFATMRLDSLILDDQEIVDFAQALGMALLSAVQFQRETIDKPRDTKQ